MNFDLSGVRWGLGLRDALREVQTGTQYHISQEGKQSKM